jgi:uncharacterized membrane protein
MDHNFSTEDLIDRARSKLTFAVRPRVGATFLPLQDTIFHSGRPLHPRLIGSGAVLLIAALATDLAYENSLLFQWENFSMWLITAGLVLAALAGLALVSDVLLHRVTKIDWLRFSGFAAAALLSVLNALVHSRDAYTAVVPGGLALSALVTAILVVIGWRGWSVGARYPARPIISEEVH